MKGLVPEIRFKGFTDDWVQRKASEIFISISDKNHPNLPVLSATQALGMVLRDEIGIDIKFDKTNINSYKRVLPGQFVIHLRSFQGGLAHSNTEGITSPAYTILDFCQKEKQYPKFWIDILRSEKFIKSLEAITYGIRDGRSISFKDFAILKLSFPNIKEQIIIGNFFRTLDDTITNQQGKLDKLKELKKGYLQQMFPQMGDSVPRARFSGFEGEWEERKLGKVAKIVAGGDVDKSKLLPVGEYPVIANALTNSGIIGYYNDSFLIEAPAVTVTGRGDVGFAQARKTNFTPVVRLLVVKSEHDIDFLENAINNLNVFVESTSIPQLTVPQLAKYEICFPDLLEQIAIGNFFFNLDEQIALQSQKLEQLKQLKVAYLQKMFV
ncbi:MAG: restriction endonuclease subunit S [Defluviitaleaceae bacterium]|nr:restriction endonuclease subunit S [Defluviitaleaceae bacterium]